jgi:hypothetical protein
LAVRFKADSYPGPSNDPRLISKASGTAANDHVFMLSTVRSSGAVRLRARVRVGGVTTTLVASSGNLQTGVWYHGAVIYDGAQLRLFLDGVAVGSTALSGAVDTDPTLAVAVGAQSGGVSRWFDGLLDDVRILQRALSSEELSGIVSGNAVPVATDDSYQVVEDTALQVPTSTGVLVNDTDGDLDPLTAVLVDDVSNGTLALNGDGSFSYTPAANFAGIDSFTYRASDSSVNSNLATVTLTVDAVNDAPAGTDDTYQATPATELLVTAANGVLANDDDADQDPLTAVLAGDVSNGTLAMALRTRIW